MNIMRHLLPAGLLLALAAPAPAADAKLPNIVFILADDLGSGDLGCYNPASKIPTPNMDKLAKEGMKFTDAHSPSSVCTPTRYGLVTGRYCWRTRLTKGVLQGYDKLLIEDGRLTVAGLLKKKGYTTACVGKWHLGLGDKDRTDYSKPLTPGPTTVGFDTFFGIPSSLDFVPYVFVENDRVVKEPTENIEASASQREGGKGFWRGGPIAPGFKHADVLPALADRAVSIVRNQADKKGGQPFFLYLPLSAPHTPWMPSKESEGKSKAGPYGDFVVDTDLVIGRLMDAIDKAGIKDNTLVVLTSDNGAHWLPDDITKYDHRSNWHYRGQKSDVHEGGHRVPFLVRWPGKVEAGTTSKALIGHVDFFATAAEIVGEKLPKEAVEDSISYLNVLLKGPKEAGRRKSLIHHSGQGMFAIRDGDWKMVPQLGSGGFTRPATVEPKAGEPKGQLYNLADDLGETKNVYDKNPEVVERLTKLLDEQRKAGRTRHEQ